MDDVRGRFLGLPHGTTPAAVTTNKNIKMSSFKSSLKKLEEHLSFGLCFRLLVRAMVSVVYVRVPRE